MSMMMPPGEAPPGLPLPPGGGAPGPGGPPMGPMDSLNQGPVPAEGGIGGLLAALGGGGGGPPGGMPGGPEGGPPAPGDEGGSPIDDMDSVDIIKEAMKLLMVALAKDEDDERGQGITKGMGALQGILGGEQKKNAQLSALGG